jgi:hypothetical protein
VPDVPADRGAGKYRCDQAERYADRHGGPSAYVGRVF